MLSLYLYLSETTIRKRVAMFVPFKFNGFDDETKCGADAIDILLHDSLHYGCFTCVIQATKILQHG